MWQVAARTDPHHRTELVVYESVFQDNLARSLQQGRGFELDFGDADWINQYSSNNLAGEYDWIYSVGAVGKSSAYGPIMPYLYFASNRLFSSNHPVEFLTSLVLAVAMAFFVSSLKQWFGWPVALVALLLLTAELRVLQSPALATGDGLLTAITVFAFILIVSGIQRLDSEAHSVWTWPLAGCLLGATTYFRFQFSLWLIIILASGLLGILIRVVKGKKPGRLLEAMALFCIGLFVVATAGWANNCRTTGRFQPLGESVRQYLVGGYCDASLENGGNLVIGAVLNNQELVTGAQSQLGVDLTNVELEHRIGSASIQKSNDWVSANSSRFPRLIASKIMTHIGFQKANSMFRTTTLILISGLGLLGVVAYWRKIGIPVFVFVLSSLLVTGLTWSDHGRLALPIQPLLIGAAAAGAGWIFGKLRERQIDGDRQIGV